MVSETPPSEIMLDRDSSLPCVRIGRPLVDGARGTHYVGDPREIQKPGPPAPDETACWLHSRAYCFIFSQNVSGLTNRTTCPGCGETLTLPHVFAEAYPWSRISFVLKFFSSSHE
jgi:hypothetical protein